MHARSHSLTPIAAAIAGVTIVATSFLMSVAHAQVATVNGVAIPQARLDTILKMRAAGKQPDETWFQLRDRCFVELKDPLGRLDNLEALVGYYPNKEYYSRIIAVYQSETKDDRTVMLNAYRIAVTDPMGGLVTVGGYLGYADTALVSGSPGEAARGLERGMKEGIVPNAGSNQASLQRRERTDERLA